MPRIVGPFAPSSTPRRFTSTIMFRCFPIVMIFATWAAVISVLNDQGFGIHVEPTLINPMGVVLGFVISYTTSSSFDKYNQGRRHWSRIIFATRNFARITWFHVPDQKPGEKEASDEVKAKRLVEKKTVINLLGAFAVTVKHYLRGEDEHIYYEDMYHSVKFLPKYANADRILKHSHAHSTASVSDSPYAGKVKKRTGYRTFTPQCEVEQGLRPAASPPRFNFFDLAPFSFVVSLLKYWTDSQRRNTNVEQKSSPRSIPLEISLYLSSYIDTVQRRGVCDTGTMTSLETLLDCYAGLECLLSSPVHASFAAHLWSTTSIFCFLLPIMVWSQFEWVTIPATAIFTFLFFGFLVAGKELQDPFGYDTNDLNLDYITNTIIKGELKDMTMTVLPFPEVSDWAFATENNHLLGDHDGHQPIPPSEWVEKGVAGILEALQYTGAQSSRATGVETPSSEHNGQPMD